jgi:hypothetical protein
MCIARKRFAHHVDEGKVAGEERRSGCRAEHSVKAAQGLSGAGYPGDKHHFMPRFRAGRLDCIADGRGGSAEIADVGARRRDICDTMSVVQHSRGLDDRRHRSVGRILPGASIQRSRR